MKENKNKIVAKQNPSYYAVITAEVRYSKKISANEKLLYGEITALCSKEGYCWAGNKHFADLYGVNTTTISVWIKNLIKAGFIESEIAHGKERKIVLRENHKGAYEKPEAGACEKSQAIPIDNKKESIKDNKASDFNSFWESYPRKVGKAAAKKSWQKVGVEKYEVIFKQLERQKRSTQWLSDGGRFIPYPATWLNGERWEDEIDIKNTAVEEKKICVKCGKRPWNIERQKVCMECFTG